MMKDIKKIQKITSPLLKQYGVKRAAVFGSVARGEATDTSDIDLLVEFKKGKSLLDLVALELDLKKNPAVKWM